MAGRFYIDEDPPEALSATLRARSHDAVNTRELGHKGQRDPWQLAFAAREKRVFLTCNHKDFSMLHEAWRMWSVDWGVSSQFTHPGILVLPSGSRLLLPSMTEIVHDLVESQQRLENRLLRWQPTTGWQE